MVWSRNPGQGPDPIGRRTRWITNIVALAVAIGVLSLTKSILWGMATFFLLGIALNLATLFRQGGRF
jgi:hypothetical protein